MNPSANWIELNDARTSDKVWMSMAMVTAIEVSVVHARMRFDKDNYITVTQKPQQVFARRHRCREVTAPFYGVGKPRTRLHDRSS